MNHVHLNLLHYADNAIDNFVRVDVLTVHNCVLKTLSCDFVRTFKLVHPLDYTFHLTALDNLSVLSPQPLHSILFDFLRQHGQYLDLLLHLDPFVLLLHDKIIL